MALNGVTQSKLMCHVMHTQCIIMGAYFLSNMSCSIQITENIQGETEGMGNN